LGGFEDAMAECALVWCECRKRYGAKVDNPAWFMALYQMMVMSRFTDLANKDTKIRATEEAAWLMDISVQPEGDVPLKLQSASKELQQVLNILFNAPREMLEGLVGSSPSTPHIFRAIADFCGISRSNVLMDELQDVLSSRKVCMSPRRRAVTAST